MKTPLLRSTIFYLPHVNTEKRKTFVRIKAICLHDKYQQSEMYKNRDKIL